MQADPTVAVMVVNYNGLRWLSRCLSTVLDTKYPNYSVYMIDNGSTDRSVEYVEQQYPSVKIIQNQSNLGFGEAYNRAIGKVEAEYIVLLNNDTQILNPEWLSSLVRIADEDPTVAAVAAKMVSMEDHRVLDSVGGTGIPYWRGFANIGREELDTNQYQNDFEPFAFCGGAALIRKSAFIDAGRLDGEMFLNYEDPDLSWRLRLLGWKIRYASNAKIAHYAGGTTGRKVTLQLYYLHRNLLRAIIKNCGFSLAWALRNYFLRSCLMIAGFLIYEPRKMVVVLRAIAWNFRNLRTTYACRVRVQSRRKVSEQEILRRMYPVLTCKQSAEHARLHRILNVLFEYGDRRKFQAAIRN